jgi:Trp operon repressor
LDDRRRPVRELQQPRPPEREAGEALGVSIATLKRDWTFAKAWLLDQLRSDAGV